MARSGVLYMKGMNKMDSDDDMEEEEDIWDDRKLNDAYDKALKMANLEVAKRVAMATNSVERKKHEIGESSQSQTNAPKSNKPQKKSKLSKARKKAATNSHDITDIQHTSKVQEKETKYLWKEGMACRAMYSVDGFDYEAVVLTILDDDTCVIRYLGYNNTEIVPISSLQPTLGKQARKDQMMEALATNEDESSTHSNFMDNDDFFEGPHVPEIPSTSKQRRPRNRREELDGGFPMPDVSSMLREFGQMDMPMPPPPLVGMQGVQAFNDDQALSNMLVSWYMSGYYTGLYHGMKRSRPRHRDC